MKQLYALIDESNFDLYQNEFPSAVKVGDYRLGVFVDTERERFEGLDGLVILTYEQALEFSNNHKEETPL